MRKSAFGILFLLASASLALSVQNPLEWIKYTSTEGRYSVSLPAQPKLRTQEATTATGEKFPQYMAAVVEPGDVAFIIGYFDIVPGTVFSADAARDGMLNRIGGQLLSESVISLGGYPGRELRVLAKPSGESEYLVRARFYETDKRIYVLQFIFPKSLENEAMAAKAMKYFDSFQVVKN